MKSFVLVQYLDVSIRAPSDAYRLQTYVNWNRHLPERDTVDPPTLVRTLRCTLDDGDHVMFLAERVANLASEFLWLEVFDLQLDSQGAPHSAVRNTVSIDWNLL